MYITSICVLHVLDREEIFPHQDREVAEIIIHEHYYKGGLHNDIALLILAAPVDLIENVNTACLPPQDYIFDGSRCYASGWGKDLWGKEGKYQVILKKIDLPIIPRKPCVEKLRMTRLGTYFNLHQSFICAGGERGKDTCKGDGGSPLVCPIPEKHEQYYQAGIVAWGIGCADVNPGNHDFGKQLELAKLISLVSISFLQVSTSMSLYLGTGSTSNSSIRILTQATTPFIDRMVRHVDQI